jgi:hypothetical protein
MNVQSIMDKVKELIAKGNVARIVVRKAEKEILNIPVTVGVAGVAVGLIWARLALLAAVLATVGFGCVVEVVKKDGGIINVVDEESSQKVREFAAEAVEKVKENIPVSINVDIRKDDEAVADADAEFADVVAEDEPKETKE